MYAHVYMFIPMLYLCAHMCVDVINCIYIYIWYRNREKWLYTERWGKFGTVLESNNKRSKNVFLGHIYCAQLEKS